MGCRLDTPLTVVRNTSKVAVPRHMDSSPASILACGFCGRPDSGDRAAELLLSDLALDSTFCLSVGKLELLHF